MINMAQPDLTYFAVTYGGVPMTWDGARRYLIAAQTAGYPIEEAIKLVPNEFRADKYKE